MNCCSFSRSLGQFFLTVGQNNFGNKIPFFWNFLSFIKFFEICNFTALWQYDQNCHACAWPSCSTIQARKKLEIHFFVIKWLSDFCPMSPFVLKVQCRCTSQTLLVLNDWIIQVPFAKQWSLIFLNIEMCHVHNDFENSNFYNLHTTFFLRF